MRKPLWFGANASARFKVSTASACLPRASSDRAVASACVTRLSVAVVAWCDDDPMSCRAELPERALRHWGNTHCYSIGTNRPNIKVRADGDDTHNQRKD